MIGPPRAASGRLVGREAELEQLHAVHAETARGACRVCTVIGPAGVGKSRLVATFLDSVAGAAVARGRCLPYGDGITYWPVVEVVAQNLAPDGLSAPQTAQTATART